MNVRVLTIAVAAVAAAWPAVAQDPPAPAARAETQAQEPTAPRPTIDSTIEALENHGETRPIIDRHLPDLTEHPAYDQFKAMTLRQLAPYSGGLISDSVISAIDAEIKALPAR